MHRALVRSALTAAMAPILASMAAASPQSEPRDRAAPLLPEPGQCLIQQKIHGTKCGMKNSVELYLQNTCAHAVLAKIYTKTERNPDWHFSTVRVVNPGDNVAASYWCSEPIDLHVQEKKVKAKAPFKIRPPKEHGGGGVRG